MEKPKYELQEIIFAMLERGYSVKIVKDKLARVGKHEDDAPEGFIMYWGTPTEMGGMAQGKTQEELVDSLQYWAEMAFDVAENN